MKIFGVLLALYLAIPSVAADLPQVEVIGNKFFFKNNQSQFLLRGIAYQQNTAERINATGDVTGFNDPLADSEACKRDVEYMINTNTNVLRVYAVDPSKNHDDCMKIFSDAGIYIIADLSEPKTSINRDNPEWNLSLYKRYTSVVDMFSKYTNVLGFFAGNEVSNNNTNTDASAFVKAAVRDTKSYIKSKGLPYLVGYSSNDDSDIRVPIAQYFACGSLDERADFFGINMYEWCGESTYKESGYEARTEEYKNLTIPLFFSEYGCNTVLPRKFHDIPVMFSNQMTHVWSGGIMYMYFQEENNYGIVSVSGKSVTTMTDYPFYSQQMNAITPSYAKASDASASSTATFACPSLGVNWKASPKLPPTPDEAVCGCLVNSLKCVVSDKVDSKKYADLFGQVCGMVDCSSVSINGTSGEYGSVSFCNDKDKLSWILNQYYLQQNSRPDACDFSGSASLVKLPSMASSCSAIISSVSLSPRATGSANKMGSSSSQGTRPTSSRRNSGSEVQPASRNSLAVILSLVLAFVGGVTSFII